MSWTTTTLGDVVDLLAGFAFKSAGFTDEPSAVRLLRGDNIAQGVTRWDGAKRWLPSQVAGLERYWLQKDDVVLAMDRPWIEAGLKFAPVRDADLPSLLVQRVARLRGRAALDQAFLRYIVGAQAFTDHVKAITTGANVPHISGRDISAYSFELPPLNIQRRIADILSAFDDLIENNTRRIAILEDMACRLFEEFFLRDGRIEDAVPVRIDALIDFDPKTKVPKNGWKPFLPMPCVPTNSMVVSKWEEREGNSGSKFLNGDTLLARITPCLENGKTAFVDFLPEGTAGFGSTEFIVMRGRAVPPEFVYCLARSASFREHAIKSMSGATGRQRVSSAAVAQFEIASPGSELLTRFGDAASPMFVMIRSLAHANSNLRTARGLLLPKLISGEIEVRAAEEKLEAAAA